MSPDLLIPLLLTLAWLAPLAGMVATCVAGRLAVHRSPRLPAWVAIAAMVVSLNLTTVAGALRWWHEVRVNSTTALGFIPNFRELSGTYYSLGNFGSLTLSLDYYIDSLTLLMFAVVTLIATCVHVYAVAYMDEERGSRDEGAEHPASQSPDPPPPLTRFFTLLQFFVFAMLGLVIAGNLLQMFIFWELVGAASYFLIGFYWDRSYAAAAATKAFVMNRIGDAGFLIGIAILWTTFGTLSFGDRVDYSAGQMLPNGATIYPTMPGLAQIQAFGFADDGTTIDYPAAYNITEYEDRIPRWWMTLAGLCLFAGCVGKSAQLPLSTWLPDAMAGPTPVSALVHSATMVAAGVYLVGRLYPLFLPEVSLVIAYVGAFTLVYGATCALVQTDLKRILAWSTVSQLGYMMLALGVDAGGRDAGLFHLVTHAFFKSLLFLAAGSVIVACHHVQDVSRLGGLRKRMPLTAYTSLVGVIAIAGLALPTDSLIGEAVAFSGYHSKDMILASTLAFTKDNPQHALLFLLPIVTAGLTAFYMFRFWLLTFAGTPRDGELHRHVNESSPLMTVPLIVLACFAAFVAVGGDQGVLCETIRASRVTSSTEAALSGEPHYYAYASAHRTASLWGLITATTGAVAACCLYGTGLINVRRETALLGPALGYLRDGWRLDAMHRLLVVRPVLFLSASAAAVDRLVFDRLAYGLGVVTLGLARLDRLFDEYIIDGIVNRIADATWMIGRKLRHVQTGNLRQYVMALAAAAAVLFALAVVLIPKG